MDVNNKTRSDLSGELELVAAAMAPGIVLSRELAETISRICLDARRELKRGGREG